MVAAPARSGIRLQTKQIAIAPSDSMAINAQASSIAKAVAARPIIPLRNV
jgi:hypothetical protein